MPGVLRQVPKWLTDDMGPLVVHWRYLPRAVPWLWRFVEAGRREAVERSADALIALTRPLFENLTPLVAEARAERLIQRVGQLHVYSTEAAFEGDRLALDLRRRRGVTFEVLALEELRQFEPALAPIFKKAVWILSLQAAAPLSATHSVNSAFAATMTLSRPAPAAANAKVAGMIPKNVATT